jgi:hypothetical protein
MTAPFSNRGTLGTLLTLALLGTASMAPEMQAQSRQTTSQPDPKKAPAAKAPGKQAQPTPKPNQPAPKTGPAAQPPNKQVYPGPTTTHPGATAGHAGQVKTPPSKVHDRSLPSVTSQPGPRTPVREKAPRNEVQHVPPKESHRNVVVEIANHTNHALLVSTSGGASELLAARGSATLHATSVKGHVSVHAGLTGGKHRVSHLVAVTNGAAHTTIVYRNGQLHIVGK